MYDGGGGKGFSSNFVHQMCHQGEGGGWRVVLVPTFPPSVPPGGGGGGLSAKFSPQTLPGYISTTRYVIAFKFLQDVGHI